MRIEQLNKLTDQQKKEIEELEDLVFKQDGLHNHGFLSTDINFTKEIKVFYLCYYEMTLVGFLTFFVPTREEAEITAVVHPSFQGQGIFTKMLMMAKEEIRKYHIGQILYCVEPKSSQAESVLRAINVSKISRSEYRMELKKENWQRNRTNRDGIRMEKACQANREAFARISREAFHEEEDDAAVENAIVSDDRRGYLIYDGDRPFGVFVLGLENEVFLYGVGISKACRGKGYGKELMHMALQKAFEKNDKVVLDVDSENPVAFHLYQKTGFEITFQVDYYVEKM